LIPRLLDWTRHQAVLALLNEFDIDLVPQFTDGANLLHVSVDAAAGPYGRRAIGPEPCDRREFRLPS
jgi:hypothetical protein